MLVLTGLISQFETIYEDTKQTLRAFMGNVPEKSVQLGLNIKLELAFLANHDRELVLLKAINISTSLIVRM